MKKWSFVLTPFLLAFVLGACSDNEETPAGDAATEEAAEQKAVTDSVEQPTDAIVVTVNGEDINGNVFNSVARQLTASLETKGQKADSPENIALIKEQSLAVIVGNKLIIQDALANGHEADEEAVESRIEELKGSFEDEEAMNASLEKADFTLDDMRIQIREQLLYESYVAENIEAAEVTDEEVQEAYDGFAEASTEEETPAFEEMAPIIRQSLEQQNVSDAVYDRIDELKAEADIETHI